MAVFDLDPARAVIIIVADGSYTGVIGSFAYIESRAGCGVYGAAVKVYRCVLGAVGNIDRVASSPDVGIGQCEVRIGGNREGVKVALFDLARDDMAEAVEDSFKYGKLVLATTTYNGSYFPFMKTFIEHLSERNYQNRTIGFIENGTWAPVAAKLMKADLEKCKNITFTQNNVKILSAVKQENLVEIDALAEELK